MKCDDVRKELTALFPGNLDGALPDAVERHVGSCDGCRAWLGSLVSLRSAIPESPRQAGPGPAYWNSLAGRIRSRVDARRPVPWPLAGSFVPSLSGAVVLLFFLYFMAVMPPPRAGMEEAVTALSGNELYEVQQAQKNTGLLYLYENGTAVNGGNSIIDLLGELIADEPLASYYAALDPVEVVQAMDDAEFLDFVDLLKKN